MSGNVMISSLNACNPVVTGWLEHIKAADASGLTYNEYAAREELSLSSLSYNKSVLRKRGYLAEEQVTFVPARVQACPDTPALRIQLPSGIWCSS